MSPHEIRPVDRSCGSYGPGHQVHWIQAKKSWEELQSAVAVDVAIDHDAGWVRLDGDGLATTLWNHDPRRLQSVLGSSCRAMWRPQFHVLVVPGPWGYLFSLATPHQAKPCAPPAQRGVAETTPEYLARAVRDNHGYSVPMSLLTDEDDTPDGRVADPESRHRP
jgi:hypothetical protein